MVDEQRVYFNLSNLNMDDDIKDNITKKSILKYEIKKSYLASLKLKIDFSHLLKERRILWNNLQREWEKCYMKEISWEKSSERVVLNNQIFLITSKIKNIQSELSTYKKERKLKNTEINKLNIRIL
jgi:hypothetical protein